MYLMLLGKNLPWSYYTMAPLKKNLIGQNYFIVQLEALRERRPPWPRQITTPILTTAKMLSLGGERPPTPNKKKVLDHYLHHDLDMLQLLWCFFCSFTHLRIPKSPPKFNQFFIILPRTPP